MINNNKHEAPEQSSEVTLKETSATSESSLPTTEFEKKLQLERDNYYDLLQRKSAEFDNYRKRTDRERTEIDNSISIDLIKELLPLIDDFERALETDMTNDEVKSYLEGVSLIYRKLLELLTKRGVTQIETKGESFNPRYHQAVAYETSPNHVDGAIIDELRRGYIIGSRLLRPAMVRVAKS